MSDLTQHVKNANARLEDERLRIVKRSEHLKVDLAVALSMAAYVSEVEKKKKPTGGIPAGDKR